MTGAIIVAAGISSRMTGQDKLFALLAGRPVLAWTVTAFEAAPEVDVIAVVVNPATLTAVLALSESEGWRKVVALPPGGARRQDSCANGLAALAIACEVWNECVRVPVRKRETLCRNETALQKPSVWKGILAAAVTFGPTCVLTVMACQLIQAFSVGAFDVGDH